MKKIISILSFALIALLVSCGGATSNKSIGGETLTKSEGWLDDDTYQTVVVGTWDRSRYYIEGEEDPVDGKEAASSFRLQDMSKTAAKVKAMAVFKEKMGAYIKAKSGVEDGKLIGEVVQSTVSGMVIAPQAIKENYSKRYDARITFQFKSKNLRKIIDKAVADLLKKKGN